MKYKPNDVHQWDSGDGILKAGGKYLVWQIREGARGQEFTLKHPDWQMVEPIVWYEVGEPFVALAVFQREAV